MLGHQPHKAYAPRFPNANWNPQLKPREQVLQELVQANDETNAQLRDAASRGNRPAVGEAVWLHAKNLRGDAVRRKFAPRWLGPFAVKHVGDGWVELTLPAGLDICPIRNMREVKRAPGVAPLTTWVDLEDFRPRTERVVDHRWVRVGVNEHLELRTVWEDRRLGTTWEVLDSLRDKDRLGRVADVNVDLGEYWETTEYQWRDLWDPRFGTRRAP